jgi:hypothetical protein
MPGVGEWGYEFHHNDPPSTFPVCGNLTSSGYATPPNDVAEAYARLRLYWRCRAADARKAAGLGAASPVFSMIGHYFYAALSASFEAEGEGVAGGIIAGSEIGENINSINAHLAFTRGAARQFGGPWIIDFSSWMNGFIRDYSRSAFWGNSSSPVGGHSLSLTRRAYFAVFMSGASALIAEAGAVNFFLEEPELPLPLPLSPLGRVGAEVYAFSHRRHSQRRGSPPPSTSSDSEAVRGIPYVPLALVSEQAHGMGIGFFYDARAWDALPLSPAEQRTSAWLQALWPGSWTVQSDIGKARSEADYMVAAPFGDIVDVLVPQNLTAAFLIAAYRAVNLAGVGAPALSDERLCKELVAYVLGGGCVILAADEAAAAAARGWLPAALLGLSLADSPSGSIAAVTGVHDLQTGWSANASQGGVLRTSVVRPTSLTTAKPWLLASLTDGSSVPAAAVNVAGAGSVVTLLMADADALSEASGLALGAHVLSRLMEDTAVFAVTTNFSSSSSSSSSDPRAQAQAHGLQMITARTKSGWNVTLINNQGVRKQPAQEETVDASAALLAVLQLRQQPQDLRMSGGGHLLGRSVPPLRLRRAWVSNGSGEPFALAVAADGMSLAPIVVPAGGLLLLGTELL